MNEAYFFNAYYAIEKRYWDLNQSICKTDTRTKIRGTISDSIENENEFRYAIEQLLNDFMSRLNKEITVLNDFFKSKCQQYIFYLNFYKNSYVQRCIGEPTSLISKLDTQKNIMEKGLKSLSIPNKNLRKFIDNAVQVLSEENFNNENKIGWIVDRIYNREHQLVKDFQKIYKQYKKISGDIYRLENEIRMETERRIKSNKEIYMGSLIIEHARNNGLISSSFKLSA